MGKIGGIHGILWVFFISPLRTLSPQRQHTQPNSTEHKQRSAHQRFKIDPFWGIAGGAEVGSGKEGDSDPEQDPADEELF